MRFLCATQQDVRGSLQQDRDFVRQNCFQSIYQEQQYSQFFTQCRNHQYQKIAPAKPQILDMEAIIADFNKMQEKSVVKYSKKQKPKQAVTAKVVKRNETSPRMKLSLFSVQLIEAFRLILDKRFDERLNELEKQRKMKTGKLFNYLCYGLQEITQNCKKNPDRLKLLESLQKTGLVQLFKQRVFKIDHQMVSSHNQGKTCYPTLKLKNQWKVILDMVKQQGNSRLRQAIIQGKVMPSLLVYATQMDLISYLSLERQNKLKAQTEGILKNAEGLTFNYDHDTDCHTTADINQLGLTKQIGQQKASTKRSKPQKSSMEQTLQIKKISRVQKRRKQNQKIKSQLIIIEN